MKLWPESLPQVAALSARIAADGLPGGNPFMPPPPVCTARRDQFEGSETRKLMGGALGSAP